MNSHFKQFCVSQYKTDITRGILNTSTQSDHFWLFHATLILSTIYHNIKDLSSVYVFDVKHIKPHNIPSPLPTLSSNSALKPTKVRPL